MFLLFVILERTDKGQLYLCLLSISNYLERMFCFCQKGQGKFRMMFMFSRDIYYAEYYGRGGGMVAGDKMKC